FEGCVATVWDTRNGLPVATWPVPWNDLRYERDPPCALSPDGERLIVVGLSRAGNADQTIAEAVEVATGKLLGRYTCPSSYTPFRPVVAPDNRSVLLPGPNIQPVVWDVVTGAARPTSGLDRRITSIGPRLAANGRFVALAVNLERRVTSVKSPGTYFQRIP